jgi:hypothetical protein
MYVGSMDDGAPNRGQHEMSGQQERTILDKLRALPPARRAEVEDFVDFLVARERGDAFDAFLAVADEVSRLGIPPMTEEEIDAEIQACRSERRHAPGA